MRKDSEIRFLFAPGAGAPSTSPWMERWSGLLAELGPVARFDYAYMQAGRKRPDPLPRLIAAHERAWQRARQELPSYTGAWVLIGKSMGGRIGCHVAAKCAEAKEGAAPTAVVCLGYPLVGTGKNSPIREAVLRGLRVPVFFVQGTKDRLCPLDRLDQVRAEIKAPNGVHVVEGGNHSLEVGQRVLKAQGRTQPEVDEESVKAIANFLAPHHT